MRSSRAVRANLLRTAVDALEQGEDGKRLPLVVLVHQVGDTIRGADLGVEVKVDAQEGDVGERVLELGLGQGKDKVLGFDLRKASLASALSTRTTHCCSFGNVGRADRSVVVGKGQDVTPEAILHKERREALSVVGLSRKLKL